MTKGKTGKEGSDKLWGGRFREGTNPLVEAYTASVHIDARLWRQDVAGSIAHASMLGKQGIIPQADADAIVAGLEEIAKEIESGRFQWREDLEDVHMNIEARLAETIGAAAGRLHTARSRNDQVATDMRLYAMGAIARSISALTALQKSILDLAEANRAAVMPGYTHLQRAQPVLLAHHLLAYFEMFERDVTRFVDSYVHSDSMPLGSGALAGVAYPIDRQAVADDLGFDGVSANSIDAVSDRDFVIDYLSASATCMMHVSRLAEEIVLWSSSEFAFIRLPDAFATGSSIMPQKKNPDVAELARGRTGRVYGNLTAMLTLMKGLPLAYNRDLQEDKSLFFDSEDVLLSTLGILAAMLPRIEVDAARCRAAARAGYILATDLADYLARNGVPFREAHEAVGKIVRHAEEQGKDLSRLSLDELRRFHKRFGEDALKLDLRASLASRDVPGGTAPRRVATALRTARKRLEERSLQ